MEGLLRERDEKKLGKGFLLQYICANGSDLSQDALMLLGLAIKDAGGKNGAVIGHRREDMEPLLEVLGRVSESVTPILYRDVEDEAFDYMPEIAQHILLGNLCNDDDDDDMPRPVSFGKARDLYQQLEWEREDSYMRRAFMGPFQTHVQCACLADLAWPQAVRSILPPEKDGSYYAREWDYLVVFDLPHTLRQFHATNLLCARYRWAVVRSGTVPLLQIMYGLCLTTARIWNFKGTSEVFTDRYARIDDLEEDLSIGGTFDIRDESGSVVYMEAPEAPPSETKKRKLCYKGGARGAKEPKSSKTRIEQLLDYNKPIDRCYFVLHNMPPDIYDAEMRVPASAMYDVMKKASNVRARVSQVISTMASDLKRFAPRHTLILTSHAESIGVLSTALRFLHGARVITATDRCLRTGFRHPSTWEKQSEFAYRLFASGATNISMKSAFTCVGRVILGDAFAGAESRAELLRLIRHYSPACAITWVCYKGSYEENLARYVVNQNAAIHLKTLREIRRDMRLLHTPPSLPSESAPVVFDEEVFLEKPAEEASVTLRGHTDLLVTRKMEMCNVSLMNVAEHFYRLRSKNGRTSEWVALPHKLLHIVHEWLGGIRAVIKSTYKQRMVELYNKIVQARRANAKTFAARAKLVSEPGKYPRRYEMAMVGSGALMDVKAMMDEYYALKSHHTSSREFSEVVEYIYIERMSCVGGNICIDRKWRCDLDLETLWAMFHEWRDVVLPYMPSIQRQLQLFSWLRPDPAEKRRNTLFLLACGCDHMSPLECSDVVGEVALMTQNNGLIGYTDAGLVHEAFRTMALRSSAQQFFDYAPEYAQEELFDKINSTLRDRMICASVPREGSIWRPYSLESKADTSTGEKGDLLQKDRSVLPSTTSSSFEK